MYLHGYTVFVLGVEMWHQIMQNLPRHGEQRLNEFWVEYGLIYTFNKPLNDGFLKWQRGNNKLINY